MITSGTAALASCNGNIGGSTKKQSRQIRILVSRANDS